MKLKSLVILLLYFFVLSVNAAYIPLTVFNGSTSFGMIRTLFFNGDVSISNPAIGQIDVEIAIDTSDIFNGSLIDNALLRGDTAGNVVQDSVVTLDDAGNILNLNSLHLNGSTSISEVFRVNGTSLMRGLVKSSPEYVNGNCGAAITVDWNNGNKQSLVLNNASCTLSFTAPSGLGTGNFLLRVVQDATGNRTVTWPGTVNWPHGTGVSLSSAANAVDMVSCYYDGSEYYCIAVFDFG
jgi:hypothetical protein